MWHEGEIPKQWKESIVLHVYKKGDKTNNYQGMSLLSSLYRFFPSVVSVLRPYADEIFAFNFTR
jgi:hypothetical protein